MTNIVEVPKKVNTSAVTLLEDVLAKIKAGEVTGVSLVVEYPDGSYSVDVNHTMSRLQSAGMLLECAIERLK